MSRDEQVTAIAESFAESMRQWLSRDEFAEMKRRNGTADYASPVCASHNFCDANMPMGAAFEQVIGHAPDSASEEDASLWNEAWSLARKLYLE